VRWRQLTIIIPRVIVLIVLYIFSFRSGNSQSFTTPTFCILVSAMLQYLEHPNEPSFHSLASKLYRSKTRPAFNNQNTRIVSLSIFTQFARSSTKTRSRLIGSLKIPVNRVNRVISNFTVARFTKLFSPHNVGFFDIFKANKYRRTLNLHPSPINLHPLKINSAPA